jgi:TonB family protein
VKISRVALLVLLVWATSSATSAQDLSAWMDVGPFEELFVAQMPGAPAVKDENASHGPLSVSGKRYTASTDGDSYIIWSFANPNLPGRFHASSEYLDACADLVWDGLLGPRRAKLPKEKTISQRMTYRSELSNDGLTGREYQIVIGELVGITRIYVQDARIYILALLSSKAETGKLEVGTTSQGVISTLGPADVVAASPDAKHFFKSFKVNQSVSAPGPSDTDSLTSGSQIEIGSGGQDVNGNRIFTGREVTQKARVVSKPEPTYTESARKYGVTGTVVLRAVFSSDGQITNIAILRRLPHGLTDQALIAARQMRFSPAQKDGQPVSMAIQLEYNFNLY